MDCPNWPPPLPSLPLYPPCKPPIPEPPPPVKIIESQTDKWWEDTLAPAMKRVSGIERTKKAITYELTSKQRRELLPIKTPTREDKLIWSVPLPEGSYPHDGLPIWERLYLDRKLPMLRSPPNALIFARQQIGKKLWKDTEGQEFILYDPHSYDVSFSYENVHDPHLTNYYQGKEIRQFLLSLGDATEDGWGLCSLKRFNQYRKYLRRVHLSLVHTEMERQDRLKNEIHKLNEYRQVTKVAMEEMERKVMMDEMRASIIEALRLEKENRIKRLLASIQEKENRVVKLQMEREREKENRRQKGLRLLAEQELKNKIATEIKRRKKIATLRRWHEVEEKTQKLIKRQADERAQQRADKVLARWQNKINTLKEMYVKEDEYLGLRNEVREKNIEIRNEMNERRKQKQIDHFQEIRKAGLRKKAQMKREKEDKKMEKAITNAWLEVNPANYDLNTEIYRIKKSINSTMAELLTTQMEGPDRFSIILMSRNRIQREQRIPLPVSYAIDVLLEAVIQDWASVRIAIILQTVVNQVMENGRLVLCDIQADLRSIGIPTTGTFKASDPYGTVYRPDPKEEKKEKKKKKKKNTCQDEFAVDEKPLEERIEKQINETLPSTEEEENPVQPRSSTVVPNYVHLGNVTIHEYPMEKDLEIELRPVAGRPKTPMPSQETLCYYGFHEDKLKDVLPTLETDLMDLKEKRKFRKLFKKTAIKLFQRSITISRIALEPMTRSRAITKLTHLGDTEKTTLTKIYCDLIMNMEEKKIYETDEFEWLAKVVARDAMREVLNPPEFRREENDDVARTKIMFYKPKQKKGRKAR